LSEHVFGCNFAGNLTKGAESFPDIFGNYIQGKQVYPGAETFQRGEALRQEPALPLRIDNNFVSGLSPRPGQKFFFHSGKKFR
jgi:hypothetical protein